MLVNIVHTRYFLNIKIFTHWPTSRSDSFVFRFVDTLYIQFHQNQKKKWNFGGGGGGGWGGFEKNCNLQTNLYIYKLVLSLDWINDVAYMYKSVKFCRDVCFGLLIKKKYGPTGNLNPVACWCHKEGMKGGGNISKICNFSSSK